MNKRISGELRKTIILLSTNCCEYCHLPDEDSYYGFQIDHIISRKHGGKTILQNLAYACPDCNRFKGSDLGTYLDNLLTFTRFFHPRLDVWDDHFMLSENGEIISKSSIGSATIKILMINHPDRIIERKILLDLGLMKK